MVTECNWYYELRVTRLLRCICHQAVKIFCVTVTWVSRKIPYIFALCMLVIILIWSDVIYLRSQWHCCAPCSRHLPIALSDSSWHVLVFILIDWQWLLLLPNNCHEFSYLMSSCLQTPNIILIQNVCITHGTCRHRWPGNSSVLFIQ